jgi:hypothetical protein
MISPSMGPEKDIPGLYGCSAWKIIAHGKPCLPAEPFHSPPCSTPPCHVLPDRAMAASKFCIPRIMRCQIKGIDILFDDFIDLVV